MKAEIHEKVWGRELWIVNIELYCGKILEVNQGFRCSMHKHRKKDETFYVLEGHILLERQDQQFELNEGPVALGPGSVIHISRNTLHRFGGITDARIVEISTQHFEDDSYRTEPSGSWDYTPYLEHLEVTDG